MSDHAECMNAGAVVASVARRLGRRAVFIGSTALTHALVRGRHVQPTPERMAADRALIDLFERGALEEIVVQFGAYSRNAQAEMGGRVLATLLGVLREAGAGTALRGRQYGEYAQSSGSGNANVLIAEQSILTAIH
jgi:3,4-dihydroxyphenylacetate 2,3-dioxygenase